MSKFGLTRTVYIRRTETWIVEGHCLEEVKRGYYENGKRVYTYDSPVEVVIESAVEMKGELV